MPATCRPKRGRRNGPEPGRQRQERVEAPPPRRRDGDPPRVPAPVQATARPLRTPRRDARSDARHRLLPHLLPPTTQPHSAMSSKKREAPAAKRKRQEADKTEQADKLARDLQRLALKLQT